MSLNGLDDVKVKEAYEVAATEPGGWFLLKYAARDEIELMERGTGGIVEIRNIIAKYEELSPLFGFLRYRRRNVLIKYVPEDCSRLVQARVTVHFNAIAEKFTPHDTVFPITCAKELRDTAISAACSLHTASGSTSSSTSSLRRRRLMEIAEDEEEEIRTKRQSTVPEERPGIGHTVSIPGNQQPSATSQLDLTTNIPPSITHKSIKTSKNLETSPPPPRERPPSPQKAFDKTRKSSQSIRPELYSYSSYVVKEKPKIKLAPRPSLDVGKRRHTSTAASFYRPVSTLPVGLKMFSKGSRKDKGRPQSHFEPETPGMPLSPPPIPETDSSHASNSRPHTSGGRPNTSSGTSMRSPTFPKPPAMTPEKARLMKALELRKKQKAAPPPANPTPPDLSDDLGSPDTETPTPSSGAPKEVHDTSALLDDMTKAEDSSIAFDATSTMRTDESDATRSDSYPVSPVGVSETAESTKASSISESTDETVQEAKAAKEIPMDDKADYETAATLGNLDSGLVKEAEELTPQHEVADMPVQLSTDEELTPQEAVVVETPRPKRPKTTEEETVKEKPVSDALSPLTGHISSQDNSEAVVTEIRASTDSSKQMQSTARVFPEQPAYSVVEGVKSTEDAPLAQAEPEVKDWKVPRSRFSSQNLRAMDIPRSKFSTQSLNTNDDVPKMSNDRLSSTGSHSSVISKDTAQSRMDDQWNSFNVKKRRGHVEPIRTDLEPADRCEGGNFSSDDELMEELRSAVVQEAKPISVSKSPMSPVFPSPSPKKKKVVEEASRTASKPLQKEDSVPKLLTPSTTPQSESTRAVSASAAYLNRINQQQAAKSVPKKVSVGSGISQRIKALEKLSGSDAPNPATTAPATTASTAFFSVRKSSVRGGSSSPSIKERANSLTRTTPSPGVSRESSPQSSKARERSGSIKSRVEAFNSSPNPPSGRAQPESISVTARIVRDSSQSFQPKPQVGRDSQDYKLLDLKDSPLVIDHQKAVPKPAAAAPIETIQERRLSNSQKSTKERRSSFTMVKDLINEKRSSFAERRRSITIDPSISSPNLMSPSRPASTHATSPMHRRPMSNSSSCHSLSDATPPRIATSFSPPPTSVSPHSPNDEKSDKKMNRASRMLRRMSSSLSSSRKNLAHAISNTVREESEPAMAIDTSSLLSPTINSQSSSTTPTSVNIGDVNVQFPDTLLWKRRCVLLDPQGFLILSPALSASSSNKDKAALGATRRFHFSFFKTLSIPDVEMQELPNSVVLDFMDGSGLQIACEDRAGQKTLLSVLQEVHHSWAAPGQ